MAVGIDDPDVGELRQRIGERLDAAVEIGFVAADLIVGHILQHLVEIARGKLDRLEHFHGVLVDRAEVALQAVLRLRHMLAVGDRRAGDEHRDRKHDDGRKQPVHRPVGSLGVGPAQRRDDVQQELFHCGLKRPDFASEATGKATQTQSVLPCVKVPAGGFLTARPGDRLA